MKKPACFPNISEVTEKFNIDFFFLDVLLL
jgi:hypothetical protein